MRPDFAPPKRSGVQRRLPLAAFAFVIAALVALALAPALVLERMSAAARELTTTLLPVHDRLRQVALAMEQQSAALRGFLLSGNPRYRDQLEAAQELEAAALHDLEPLLPRISPALAESFDALQRLSSRRYIMNTGLMEAGIGVEAYRMALPELDMLRDSTLLYLRSIDRAVVRVTSARVAEEERWAGRQRALWLFLGILAVLAALLVGWFAWRQRLLAREIEQALAEANRSRSQAERRREELERVTESRARLMRGFSHDVKNPLGAADGYLQLLADGIVDPLTERQARSVERASKSIGAALNLVEDLLELARAETGTLEVALFPTNLAEVVRDAAEEYQAQAEAKGLDLSLQVPAGVPPVTTDGKRVRQVLGNLISNAVKYTPSGGVTIRLVPSQWVEGAKRGSHIGIEVTDTGPGIPAEQRHLLFEEFVRLDPTVGRGAGIGLTISHRLAQALGGEITVASEIGTGSTFTLWLPSEGPRSPASSSGLDEEAETASEDETLLYPSGRGSGA
jgi:signal transduction histidine kinase